MLTFDRGGKGVPLGGLLITIVGVVLTVGRFRMGDFGATDLALSAFCLITGPLMILLFSRVEIDPKAKVVRLASGFRFSPRHRVHDWNEFDSVVASESSALDASNNCYHLYLRKKESQEKTILVQQFDGSDEMHRVANELSQLMGLPPVMNVQGEESYLV